MTLMSASSFLLRFLISSYVTGVSTPCHCWGLAYHQIWPVTSLTFSPDARHPQVDLEVSIFVAWERMEGGEKDS